MYRSRGGRGSYGLVMTETVAAPAHETVWSLTNAVVPAACLHVIAEIGVADRLDEPTTVDDLAQRCSVDPAALDRVLRLLVSHGIFERDGVSYRHNDESALLRSDHPRSMRAFARMMGLPVFGKTWGALDHSLISGAPAIEQVAGGGLWSYLRSHPDEAAIFNSAMESKAQADIDAVMSAYDFRPFGAIADVAGGRGHLLRAVLDSAPSVARHPVRAPRRSRVAARTRAATHLPRRRLLRRSASPSRLLPPDGDHP